MEKYVSSPWFAIFILPVVIWSLIWKGIALWKSARLGQKNWFIAPLIINTLGILEILYVYHFSKSRNTNNYPKDIDKL